MRWSIINIIVHYPDSEQAKQELREKVAILHAQTVIDRMNAMQLSPEQRKRLIEAAKITYYEEKKRAVE